MGNFCKKLYREFFYVPQYGKVREKVMLARMASSIAIVIMCLAGMSLTAYAYFTANVTSGFNYIKSANFEADVVINITDESGSPVPVTAQDAFTKNADLLANTTYRVVLDEAQNSTAKTGFCIITATGSNNTYHTQQLGVDTTAVDGITEKIEFDLMVTEDTTVSFLSHWGTSSHYAAFAEDAVTGELYITNARVGENKVVITITNNVVIAITKPENTELSEPTDPPATEATTAPTTETTAEPTVTPTTEATAEPTATPTTEATAEPTATPTTEATAEPTATPTTEATAEPTVAPTTEVTTESTEVTYTVQSGDTLWEISGMFNVSSAALKSYNNLSDNTIVTGDVLNIPSADYVPPEETTATEASAAATEAPAEAEEITAQTEVSNQQQSVEPDSTDATAVTEPSAATAATDETTSPTD